MPRVVIDLSRDLPYRASPLAERALAKVFGGAAPCLEEGATCGTGGFCCGGLVCRNSSSPGMMGIRVCTRM